MHRAGFSNFQTQCYGPDYQQYEDIPDFFEAAVGANLKYPTWDYLAAAGITPSNTTKYTLGQIEAALYNATGAMPYVSDGSSCLLVTARRLTQTVTSLPIAAARLLWRPLQRDSGG